MDKKFVEMCVLSIILISEENTTNTKVRNIWLETNDYHVDVVKTLQIPKNSSK